MSGEDTWFEQSGDELDDNEFPDHQFDDESTETLPCPQCGAQVYEEAERCPVCGTYIIQASVWTGRPGWWILLALLGIGAAILALAGFIP